MIRELEDAAARIAAFDFRKEAIEIMIENQEVLLALLQVQMSKGVDADGKPITLKKKGKPPGAYYELPTIRKKEEYGNPPLGDIVDRVTLFFTGDFYYSMYANITGTEIQIFSNVAYEQEIYDKITDRTMELSAQSMELFKRDYLQPQLAARWQAIQ